MRLIIRIIINERKSITPEMALRLAHAFPGSTPESWLNLQRNYDLWQAAFRSAKWKNIHPVHERGMIIAQR